MSLWRCFSSDEAVLIGHPQGTSNNTTRPIETGKIRFFWFHARDMFPEQGVN